jgi:hypothetical protein
VLHVPAFPLREGNCSRRKSWLPGRVLAGGRSASGIGVIGPIGPVDLMGLGCAPMSPMSPMPCGVSRGQTSDFRSPWGPKEASAGNHHAIAAHRTGSGSPVTIQLGGWELSRSPPSGWIVAPTTARSSPAPIHPSGGTSAPAMPSDIGPIGPIGSIDPVPSACGSYEPYALWGRKANFGKCVGLRSRHLPPVATQTHRVGGHSAIRSMGHRTHRTDRTMALCHSLTRMVPSPP